MPQVAGVRLRYSKTLWFDPQDLVPQVDDIVIVSTERGEELGMVRHEIVTVEESALPAELKPIVRIATEEDLAYAIELQEKEKSAMPTFRELITKNKLDMKPVDIEYIFGGDKVIFYFSSDDRVDFRQLVKDLAAHFHMRIDMRQVGVRDEARMVGGVGHCGEILCCARLGGEFAPVSIKMAKDQGLPPNPIKISGACGRLMCCLRYEVDAYKDFNNRAPKKGASIDTPKGSARVVDVNVLREIIKVRFESAEGPGEVLEVPLDKMCCKKGGGCGGHGAYGSCASVGEGGSNERIRPSAISAEALAEIEEGPVADDQLSMPTVTYTKLSDARDTAEAISGPKGVSVVDNGTAPESESNASADEKSGKGRRRNRRRKKGKGESNGAVASSVATESSAAPGASSSEAGSSDAPARKRPSRRRPKPTGGGSTTPSTGNTRAATSEGNPPSSAGAPVADGRIPRRRNRG